LRYLLASRNKNFFLKTTKKGEASAVARSLNAKTHHESFRQTLVGGWAFEL
jgi:hypothetical protein